MHTVAAVVDHGALTFDFAIPCEVFGFDRRDIVDPWYAFRVVAAGARRVQTETGFVVEAADVPLDGGAVYEIGGADAVPYRAILEGLGGRPLTVPAPGIVADVATLLKPLQPERARVVSDLLDSLRVDTSVHDDAALRDFSVRPRGLADALHMSD